jgi:hypothetical protein
VLGFASLVVYRISAIRHLGIFAVFGITALFVLALTFTVAALALLRVQHGSAATARETKIVGHALDAVVRFSIGHRLGVTASAIALVLFFGWGIRYVAIETSYLSYFPPGSPILESADAVSKYMDSGQATFLVVVDGRRERHGTPRRAAPGGLQVHRPRPRGRPHALTRDVKLLTASSDDDPHHGLRPPTPPWSSTSRPRPRTSGVVVDSRGPPWSARLELRGRDRARRISASRDSFPDSFVTRPAPSCCSTRRPTTCRRARCRASSSR